MNRIPHTVQRRPPLALIRGDWDFRKLRGDLRFKALLAKMHLDE